MKNMPCKNMPCKNCGGSGKLSYKHDNTMIENCSMCGGKGTIPFDEEAHLKFIERILQKQQGPKNETVIKLQWKIQLKNKIIERLNFILDQSISPPIHSEEHSYLNGKQDSLTWVLKELDKL